MVRTELQNVTNHANRVSVKFQSLGKFLNLTYRVLLQIPFVFTFLQDIFMILSLFYCILKPMLLSPESVIAKNHAVFGVQLFCLKFGLCKENYILQLWIRTCSLLVHQSFLLVLDLGLEETTSSLGKVLGKLKAISYLFP